MAKVASAKTEADLIRKVRLIDETMTSLTTSLEGIQTAVENMETTLVTINDNLILLTKYMNEILGDKIE